MAPRARSHRRIIADIGFLLIHLNYFGISKIFITLLSLRYSVDVNRDARATQLNFLTKLRTGSVLIVTVLEPPSLLPIIQKGLLCF